MHIPRHSSRSTQPTINRSFSHRFKKRTGFRACPFSIQKSRRTEADPAECPRLCQRESCPVIDHFSGSDRRYPDPALWSALPAKILPVCGTGGRCGNRRHEDSSRLRCRGVCLFAGVAANMCSSQKIPRLESQGAMRKYRNRERKSVRRLRRSGCSFLQACLPACVLRKKTGRRTRGRCENTEIRSGSLSIACPVQGVCFYRCACPYAVFRTKNPPAGKPGDFYQAFAVR